MQWATPEERSKLGQAHRKQIGRQAHDALDIKARTRTPLQLLQRSMRDRIPALVKLKYELMAESPFGYFRGAVPVMAADLAALPNTMLLPMAGWSSTSTTSTKPSAAPSSGTSSAWPRPSLSPAAVQATKIPPFARPSKSSSCATQRR